MYYKNIKYRLWWVLSNNNCWLGRCCRLLIGTEKFDSQITIDRCLPSAQPLVKIEKILFLSPTLCLWLSKEWSPPFGGVGSCGDRLISLATMARPLISVVALLGDGVVKGRTGAHLQIIIIFTIAVGVGRSPNGRAGDNNEAALRSFGGVWIFRTRKIRRARY